MGTIRGNPAADDQVATASPDLVNPDLVDLADFIPEADRYSYSFNGNAQTLDHVLATQNLVPQFAGLVHGRVNADFPEVVAIGSRTGRSGSPITTRSWRTSPSRRTPWPRRSPCPPRSWRRRPGPRGRSVAFTVTATDNLDTDVAITCTVPTPSLFAIGTTSVSCTATDDAGNASTDTFSVVVQDTIAPVMGRRLGEHRHALARQPQDGGGQRVGVRV